MKIIIFSLIFLLFGLNSVKADWVAGSGTNHEVNAIVASGNNVFAATGSWWTPDGHVFISTDFGSNWTQTSFAQIFYSLGVSGNYLFAGVNHFAGVYVTTNNGANWTQVTPLHLMSQHITSILTSGSNIYIGGWGPGHLAVSTNTGTNWVITSLNQEIMSTALAGNYLYAGSKNNGVYLSTNNGTDWQQTSLNNKSVYSLIINNGKVFAGTISNGIFTSTNNGVDWTQTSLNYQSVRAFAVSGTYLFAGTENEGVYLSTNNGVNWSQKNDGFPWPVTILSLCIVNNYVIAGSSISAWRRPLSEFLGLKNISYQVPNEFSLSQNYPNPFNPKSKIKFQIAKLSGAKMVIFDILGREVASLVNEQLKPGTYEVEWDASSNPSGVYFYRLITDKYIETKKMVLIK